MQLLLTILGFAAQVVFIAMAADFVAGLIHWAEDAYFTEDTPIIGQSVIKPNIIHHHFPRYFTQLSWWESSKLLVFVGTAALGVSALLGWFSWQLTLFVVISVNANHVHKLSHRTRQENGPFITKLQDWKILLTPHQHGLHHTDPKNTYYCPITNLVNPILERINFWERAEAVIERLTGITQRHDTAVRGNGPTPPLARSLPSRTTSPRHHQHQNHLHVCKLPQSIYRHVVRQKKTLSAKSSYRQRPVSEVGRARRARRPCLTASTSIASLMIALAQRLQPDLTST